MQVHNTAFITTITNFELLDSAFPRPLQYIEASVFLFSFLDAYEIHRPALGWYFLHYWDTSGRSHLWDP